MAAGDAKRTLSQTQPRRLNANKAHCNTLEELRLCSGADSAAMLGDIAGEQII